MQKILFTLFTSCLLFTQLSALIIETPNLNRFEETLETIDQQSLVLFDVDETLLIPKEEMCRTVNEQLAKFQLRHLAKTGEWLSDQEALSIEPGLYSINEVLDAVSENYRPSINQAISLIAPKEAVDKIQFKPLLGGLTKSKVFRVDIENKKYVLRLLDENQPPERKRSELNAHKIGAGCKIAPEIIYADQTPLVILMEYIEGRTLTKDDLNNADIVKKVMCALKKFHQHPKERDLIRRTKVEAIQGLYDRYKNKKGVVFPSCFDQLHSELKNDFAELKTEHMPSHGDFNPRNILIAENGHIYIIDWAQASIDHPFLDIGWLATFSAANNEQVRGLLREYLEREPKESELKEALFFKDVTTFLVATLWIGRQEERNQIKLDSILEGSLKNGSAYIMDDISVEDILKEKKMSLTLYSLGWLKEFIDSRRETTEQ